MKRNLVFLVLLMFALYSFSNEIECYPDSEGNYLYYCNVKNKEVFSEFSKEDFITLVSTSDFYDEQSFQPILDDIVLVEKSFPTGSTELLQQSLSVYSTNGEIESQLSALTDIFNFCEKVCYPEEMLLYEPNDYRDNQGNPFTHLELIKGPEAWRITDGDSRILVGVTDTYIETTHEDLTNKISSVVTNSSNPHWHGIAASGAVAAETDNDKGIAAIGFNVEIVFSSIMNDNEVLQIAQMPGVRVINCSWVNNCTFSQTQSHLYNTIRNTHNVIVVAGAGNNATHCGRDNFVYPAAYNSVISVTSVGHKHNVGYVDPIYGATNWKDCHQAVIGDDLSTHHHNTAVNICAPGYNVASTYTNNSYQGVWGTSFASPIVAGVCALVASVNPCLTAQEIQNIVLSTADPSIYNISENANYIGLLGSGRVDAEKAVEKAVELELTYVQNITYSTTAVETSETALISGATVTNSQPYGNVVVSSGSNVTFEATHSIELSEGFKVENNSIFKAKIYDSSCF
jgi:subtilisin family serine protease